MLNSQGQLSRLPPQAYKAATDAILKCGFSRKAMLDNYSFSTRNEQIFTTDILAFADRVQRTPDHAAITIHDSKNSSAEDKPLIINLAQSSAPLHLVNNNDKFSLWGTKLKQQEIEPFCIEADIEYANINEVFAKYANDINPSKIVAVKQGREQFAHQIFQEIEPLQLSIFVEDVTRGLLTKYFGLAVDALRQKQARSSLKEGEIQELALQMLGALILADTGVLDSAVREEAMKLSLSNLIESAYKNFPLYFDRNLFNQYSKNAETAYTLMRHIRYSGFVRCNVKIVCQG